MPGDLPTSFARTLTGARAGEERAWSALYHDHGPALLGYLRSQRAPDPEDLLGEVWIQAVRDLPRFSGDEGGFRAWLLQIAHHRLLDARRAQSRRPVDPAGMAGEEFAHVPMDPHTETHAVVERRDAERALVEILEQLPERQREVLYLRYVLDLDQAQAAAVLGVSRPALKMLQGRATRALRGILREQLDTDVLPLDGERRLE